MPRKQQQLRAWRSHRRLWRWTQWCSRAQGAVRVHSEEMEVRGHSTDTKSQDVSVASCDFQECSPVFPVYPCFPCGLHGNPFGFFFLTHRLSPQSRWGGVSLCLSKMSLITTFCGVRKEPHFPMGSPRTCIEIVTYWTFSYCVLDPTQACECLFIFLCPALCLSRLGALHHSYNTPQPDLQCPELYKQPHEGMLFMSHTELALCPGHCMTNFLKEKGN